MKALERPTLFEKLILIGPSACYLNRDGYNSGFDQSNIEGLLESIDENYPQWARTMAPVLMKNPERLSKLKSHLIVHV